MAAMRRGILALIGAVILFSIMNVMVKLCGDIPSKKIAMFRFLTGLVLLCSLAAAGWIRLQFGNRWLLVLRGLLGGTSVIVLFISIQRLGVAVGVLLNYTFPLFAALGGMIFLKERVGALRWLAMSVAAGGLYLAVSPADGNFGDINPYVGLGLFGGFCGGMSLVTIRKLRQTSNSYTIYFAQCAMGMLLVLTPIGPAAAASTKVIGWNDAAILLGIGLLASAGQILHTYAYRHVPIAIGGMFGLMAPGLSALIGLLVLDEPVTRQQIIGMAIVLAACVVVVRVRPTPPTESADRSARPETDPAAS